MEWGNFFYQLIDKGHVLPPFYHICSDTYLAYMGFSLVFDKLEIQIEVNLIYYYDNLSQNLIVKNLADIWEYILKKDGNTTYIYILLYLY